MQDTQFLTDLNRFHGLATKATYASVKGVDIEPQRKGFRELEYSEGDWYYRDSYTGFLRSWGQEVIYYQNKPVWTCLYGGGMEPDNMQEPFALETFSFLKKALSSGDKTHQFQPRGPEEFNDNAWQYECDVQGDISVFDGLETITFQDVVVFTHRFHGGLVIGRS